MSILVNGHMISSINIRCNDSFMSMQIMQKEDKINIHGFKSFNNIIDVQVNLGSGDYIIIEFERPKGKFNLIIPIKEVKYMEYY